MTTGKDGTARVSHTDDRGRALRPRRASHGSSPRRSAGSRGARRDGEPGRHDQDVGRCLPARARACSLGSALRSPRSPSTRRPHVWTSDGREHILALATRAGARRRARAEAAPAAGRGPTERSATMRGATVVVRQDGKRSMLRHRDASPRSRSRLRQFLATASNDHDRPDLECRDGRARSRPSAQHRGPRRAVQPGRALARDGDASRQPLGRDRRDDRPPPEGA